MQAQRGLSAGRVVKPWPERERASESERETEEPIHARAKLVSMRLCALWASVSVLQWRGRSSTRFVCVCSL